MLRRRPRAALEAVRAHPPDVLILDQRMPGLTGVQVLKAMSESGIMCRTVLLTAAVGDDEVVEAVRLRCNGRRLEGVGARGRRCSSAVRRVYQGEQWIDRETLSRALGTACCSAKPPAAKRARTSPRASLLEIVRMIAQGLRNKAIAERLSISEGTVKIHLHNIYEKLGVDGRLELVLFAQAKGIV